MEKLDWGDIAHMTVQYNLQQKDAALMDPLKIAEETLKLGCDTVCINVCGACTWYPTAVPCLKVHPLVAQGRDLLGEMLDACHAVGVKVLGRFAWGMMEDDVFHQKPQWACRRQDGTPINNNAMRPGEWNLLYQACYNGGYQRTEVMLPAMLEVVRRYDIDGVFWCAGFASPCWCDHCKQAYLERYGKPMPDSEKAYEPDWLAHVGESCTELFFNELQRARPGMPFIRYYWPFELDMGFGRVIEADNILAKAANSTTLCTEAQDILSLGVRRIPSRNTPALRMKMGRIAGRMPAPIGIIHTCPGMDWRHVGMPEAEYLYWSSQIPANGGRFWISLTGFFDTVTDKRIVETLAKMCGMIRPVLDDMNHALSAAQVLLFGSGSESMQGWAHALMCSHIDFDMTAPYAFDPGEIGGYDAVIVPRGTKLSPEQIQGLRRYAELGGSLILEGVTQDELKPYASMLRLKDCVTASEELVATYARIEESGGFLRDALGDTRMFPLRGRVGFCEPPADSVVAVTWVPPFSSFEASGNPPERASLPTPQTNVPLCVINAVGDGRIMLLPYEAGMLVERYGLRDSIDSIGAYVRRMMKREFVQIEAPEDVMLTQFQKGRSILLHFVNGVGERPLKDNVPCHGVKVRITLPEGRSAAKVTGVISGAEIAFRQTNGVASFELPPLSVWEMVRIETN